ncbi:UMP kinase [Patescibacteria group bacterium]|nr:MAG: UMP kinase [Patescibacteria group bacterium]
MPSQSKKPTKSASKKAPVTVISLGGSMIVPNLPDPKFVKEFVEVIKARVKKGRRFIIVAGGGKVCRNYQDALTEIRKISSDENDWMGIYSTHFNAQFMRLAFGTLAEKEIAIRFGKKINFKKSVLVAAGELPGHSTDFDAVLLAKMFGGNHVVNISNIDFVYTADPRKDKNAKAIPKLNWKEYLALLPKKWTPGFSSPFDMKAAEIARKAGLTVSIVNGRSFDDIKNALDQKEFRGSTIAG